MKIDYSVVVPVYNEAGNISLLHAELAAVLCGLGGNSEIIYVDDGSTDGTAEELRTLATATVITLNRNYGQATALDAGFRRARGAFVISLDGDGQNDPADIPRLLEKLTAENLDVVAGWRKVRHDRGSIRFLTKFGRLLRRLLIDDEVHDTGCTLRVYRIGAVRSLDLQGEMHRYVLALLRWKGFRIGEMVVGDRVRKYGVSKYGLGKAIRGFIDLVYIWFIHKYSQRPLHLFGYASLIAFVVAVFMLGFAVYQKIYLDIGINRSGYFLVGSFLILGSLIMFSFGVVIDLLLKIHLNNSPFEKRYTVREIVEM
jgi:glycosyltransferase involved in cell wall biosynthesis